ncbi:MAG TPA: ABC transporter permease [Candidatus Acutalibacter stercorigallinarum]|nr:ABC transporter permease [Candidatus Acutalibacter stercorigallinarum]
MVKYVLKRLGYSIVTLFVLVALTFFLQQCLPGDPFIGDKALPEATMAALRAKYGLDKSLPEQFLIYIGNCLHGDLGLSLQTNRSVTDTILDSFKVSFDLGIRAIIFAFILGVVLGTVAAIKRGKAADTICMFIALIGVSVPSFIMASLLQYYLGLQLGNVMRDAGMPALFATSNWGEWNTKVLPVLALGFGSLAQISRLTRTSMLDVLGQDYIKTARAKGLSQPAIIWRHALRNAITPVVTVLGPITAGVLTGAFVVENIFAIPGLGKYFVTSIQVLDYTMISGTTIFYGAFLILANLVVDLVYGVIDPRVKLEEG